MLSLLRRRLFSQLPRSNANRYFSETVSVGTEPVASTSSISSSEAPRVLPYFIPRNTRGNLPIYTDVRNAGGRYMVLVRNVEGNIGVCFFYCCGLASALFIMSYYSRNLPRTCLTPSSRRTHLKHRG